MGGGRGMELSPPVSADTGDYCTGSVALSM